MKKKYILITIFLILFLVLNCILSIRFGINFMSGLANLDIPSKFTNHHSDLGNFTISLPETWIPRDMSDGNRGDKNVVLIIRNISENLYIDVSKYENIYSEIHVKDLVIKKINVENNGTYTSISLESFQGKKYSGLLNEYTIAIVHPFLGKRDFHCFGWYAKPKTDIGYSFSFCVEEKNWKKTRDIFLEIINSVDFN